jgi:hypothetical protein
LQVPLVPKMNTIHCCKQRFLLHLKPDPFDWTWISLHLCEWVGVGS